MDLFPDLIADVAMRSIPRVALPEHRQIELYTSKKALTFGTAETRSADLAGVGSACTAFLMVQAALETDDAGQEGLTTWDIYKALPRATTGERAVAELFRILRVVRKVAVHRQGQVVINDGLFRFFGAIDGTVLALDISRVGLDLLASAVVYYLGSLGGPYSAAYVEAMLLRYFADIVGEIKRFSDEGRSLYQFRETVRLNRHLRLDCDTVRARSDDAAWHFDIGVPFRDARTFPIDFFVVIRDVLHIIPAEALLNGVIAATDFPRWRARVTDGTSLPAGFRTRFAHEIMPTDVPMT